MEGADYVWVELLQPGVAETVVDRLYFAEGRFRDVATLRDAAKEKFGPLLAHVAAAQLSVSATRDGEKLDEDALVVNLQHGGSRAQPLYIHAPAAPPQAPVASMGISELPGLLREMEDKRLQEESRREERLLEAISAIKGQKGSQEAPGGEFSTTSFLSSYWLGVQSFISTLKVRNGSSISISPTCLPTNSSGFSLQISAPGSRNALVSEAEAAPLLRERGGSSCTRRNGHSCQRE
mmetsp:Transcript_36188/g.91025  ORF Transcript_36188/g.91025 Transcript_36188/m.91025 type:complete len:236 (+) Transcript_36188:351-1058(+)